MRVAVVGSRSLTQINLEAYLPPETTEIISGGAHGVDQIAKEYAQQHHIKYTEFLPDYARYRRCGELGVKHRVFDGETELIRLPFSVEGFWSGSLGAMHNRKMRGAGCFLSLPRLRRGIA